MDPNTLHGWYSKKQLNATKKSFYYKDINENEVHITMVSNTLNPTISFDDLEYMGIMKSFVKKINHKE